MQTTLLQKQEIVCLDCHWLPHFMGLTCNAFVIHQRLGPYTEKSFIKGRQVGQDFFFAMFTAYPFLSFPSLVTFAFGRVCSSAGNEGAEVAGQKCSLVQNKHLRVTG